MGVEQGDRFAEVAEVSTDPFSRDDGVPPFAVSGAEGGEVVDDEAVFARADGDGAKDKFIEGIALWKPEASQVDGRGTGVVEFKKLVKVASDRFVEDLADDKRLAGRSDRGGINQHDIVEGHIDDFLCFG